MALMVHIFTFVWFVPNIILLSSGKVLTMNPDAVASIATWWVNLNWVRAALLLSGWMAALRCLALPLRPDND
jgi:hypothetical protein